MGTTSYFWLWLCMATFISIDKVECLFPPVYLVTSPDGNLTVEEGQPIKLSCEAYNSNGQLQWDLPPSFKLRASAITWENRQSTINQTGMSKLIVDEAVIGDSGKFDCRVENIVKSVYVNVKASEIHDIVLDSENMHDRISVKMAIVPPRRKIQIMEGESVRVNCSVNLSHLYPHVMMNAQLAWITKKHKVHQRRVDNSTITLIIDNANSSDAGFYTCWFNTSHGSIQKRFHISVITKSKNGAVCSTSQFLCEKHHHCIFVRYRCNGQEDCLDGSDEHNCEENPCVDQFPCLNGLCVDRSRVCDIHHENDCGDWSDEQCLYGPQFQTSVNETTVDLPPDDPTEEDQMTWLKTTVYAVIGCTVGIVLFISIIVVAVFRIRMKRDACNQRERAVQHQQGTQSIVSHNSRRGGGESQETQPFIEGRQNYGNIIVNVNNGVQYVPVSEFVVMESPPTYSEVVEEIQVHRNSPPPDYSTLDRFPQRPNSLQVATTNNRRTPHRGTRQPAPSSDNQGTLPPYTADNSSRPPTHSVSVQTTRSQTAGQSGRAQYQRGGDSTRTSTSQALPKQPNMAVHGGQIILHNQQLPTIPCSPTSSVPASGGTQPAQLQVQGGQIMLSGSDSTTGNIIPPTTRERSRSPPQVTSGAGRSRSPPQVTSGAGRSRSPPQVTSGAGRSRSPPQVPSGAGRDLPPLPSSQPSHSSAPPGNSQQEEVPTQSSGTFPGRPTPSDTSHSEAQMASSAMSASCNSPQNPLSNVSTPSPTNNASISLPLNIQSDNVSHLLPNIPPNVVPSVIPQNTECRPLTNIESAPLPINIESLPNPADMESQLLPVTTESSPCPLDNGLPSSPVNIESLPSTANIESHHLPPPVESYPIVFLPSDVESVTPPGSVVSELTADSLSVLQGKADNNASAKESSLLCQPGTSSVITPCDDPQGGALDQRRGAEDEALYDAPWERDLDLFISEIPDRCVPTHSDSLLNQNHSGSSPDLVHSERDIGTPERNPIPDFPSQSTSPSGGHNYESIDELRNYRTCDAPLLATSSANNTIQVVDGRICLSNQNTFPRMSDSHHHPKTSDSSSSSGPGQLTVRDGNIVLT